MMLTVYSADKKKVGEIALPEAWMSLHVNHGLLFSAVHAVLTNRRQGTVSTKTRGEVRGSNKKPYKQKGTGNARQGTYQSPIFVGGGQTFGPRPRTFHDALPVAQRRLAFVHALVQKIRDEKVMVIDAWTCAQPKTKPMAAALQKLGIRNGLLVLDAPNEHLMRSVRNIPNVGVREARCVNAHDVLQYDTLVVTKAAWEQMQGRVAA